MLTCIKPISLSYFLFEDVCLGFGAEIVANPVYFLILAMVANKCATVLKKFVMYRKAVRVSDIHNWSSLGLK